MPKDFNNWTLTFSRKIYGRLLLAYPKAYREEYGPAMAQLFRDQCRDAWNEAHGWGLVKLWLRVLPDLVKTSVIERCSTLTKRKSVSDKMATLIQPRAIFLKVFAVVFLLIFGYSVAVAFLLPESYASYATIWADMDEPVPGAWASDALEIIQSQAVLAPVIDNLHLNAVWGGKNNGREPLNTDETMLLLKNRMSLNTNPNGKLIFIEVISEDKNEAADIANAIAKSYTTYYHLNHSAKGMVANKHNSVAMLKEAKPALNPIRPNKPLVGAICGIILASALGGAAAFVATRIRKRKEKMIHKPA